MKSRWCLIFAMIWILPAHAEADGSDYFRVSSIVSGKGLEIHTAADKHSAVLRVIPGTATCLRNVGCHGGLSFEEFSALSKDAQALKLAANPHWCKIEYQGTSGWVEGRYLGEGACESPPRDPNQKIVEVPRGKNANTLKGRIRGDEYVDHHVRAAAGQTLSVTVAGSHPQNYFNVLPNGSE